MSERRYFIGDLFKAYAAEKADEEWHGEWGGALVYRPIAILMAHLLLRLAIPATAVTVLSLGLALSLPAIAIFAGPAGYFATGICAALVGVLDCVDGTIARATGTTSRFGQYLDFLTDILFRAAFYAAIGILAAAQAPAWLAGRVAVLAIIAALLAIVARLCRVYGELLTGARAYDRAGPASGPPGLSVFLFSVISGLDPLLPFIVLAAGAWRGLGWLVLWLLLYSALDFSYTQWAILRRLA